VTVPDVRKVARTFLDSSRSTIENSLKSPLHEERLAALLVLVEQYAKSKNENTKKEIFDFYLKNKHCVNNWDLVDLTAHKIVGDYLLEKDRKMLYDLAKSPHLWDRRIAVISTFAFLPKMQFKDSLQLCEKLLNDKHDLMHKACGWVLREIGKRDEKALEGFLHKHAQHMPRTMLRYAIEKFPEEKRQMYLRGKFT
jgi:3-methyladenine DNA glycosylase AlkD